MRAESRWWGERRSGGHLRAEKPQRWRRLGEARGERGPLQAGTALGKVETGPKTEVSKWTAPRRQSWEEDIGEDGAAMNTWKSRCRKDLGAGL